MASHNNCSLREMAAECFLSLEIGTTDRPTRLRWRAWLAESADHRNAFEACRQTWIASAGVNAQLPCSLELSRDRYDGEAPIASRRVNLLRPDQPAETHERFHIPRSGWMALAASLVLVIVVSAWYRSAPVQPVSPMPIVYETGRGEQRQLTLPDGSVIMMGPEVRLEVRFLSNQRVFQLRRGEAIFTVAHDPSRPFRVYAGSGWIDDIGTTFDVRSDANQVTVTVIQGEVEIGGAQQDQLGSPRIRLTHDQQLSFGATRSAVRSVDARQATAWRDGQLAYIDQSLENVVADLRRYSMKDIVMQDKSVGALRYTGTVSIAELDHWAAGLTRVYPVQILVQNDRLLIAAKRKDR